MRSTEKIYIEEVVAEELKCPYCYSTERAEYGYGQSLPEVNETHECEMCGKTFLIEGEDWSRD